MTPRVKTFEGLFRKYFGLAPRGDSGLRNY
jgi:hypothetical protein